MKAEGLKIWAVVFSALVLSLGLSGFVPAKLYEDSVLVMNVEGAVPEYTPFNPFWGLFAPAPLTVTDKVMVLRKASVDRNVKALVVAVRDNSMGMGKAQELRDAILRYRKSGKPAACCIEMEGQADLSYYLASSCDQIYVSPASFMSVNGLTQLHFYLGGFFEKVKLSVQVLKVKEYKTFGDTLSRRDMSPFDREMSEALLNSSWDQFLNGIAAGRNKSKAEIAGYIDQDLLLPEKYQAAGMVDGVKYLDEVIDGLKKAGGNKDLAVVKEREYAAISPQALGVNVGPKVAVIYGVGSIVNLDPGGSPWYGSIMPAEITVMELEEAAKDDSIKGVIFRVDSPGGSALASDLIWRATQKLREKKPLVVSMSDVAGSGGYYISAGADAIVAHPGTLTGSIGVVSAHIGARGLLGWLQVGTTVLSKGTYAQVDNWTRPWTESEQAKEMDGITGVYNLFVDRVSKGRKMSKEDVDKIGKGRVYTGLQAKELGLVDELGGIDVATEIIKKKLGVKDLRLVYHRKPITLWKILLGKTQEDLVGAMFGPVAVDLKNQLVLNSMYKDGEKLFLSPTIRLE